MLNLAGERRVFRIRIAPLHDVVVLHAHDGKSIEVMFARERLHVGDVARCEGRRELDDDTTGREFEIERVLGIEWLPVRGLRRCVHLGHGHGLFRNSRSERRRCATRDDQRGESRKGEVVTRL